MPDPIPPQYAGAIPYLIFQDAGKALDFYAAAFGGIQTLRLTGPDGAVIHAEMRIGAALFMLGAAAPGMGYHAAEHFGGSPVTISIHVEDVDSFVAHAQAAGATLSRPPENQFYGDRAAALDDPFGLRWSVATHVEDVDPAEMQTRLNKMFSQHARPAPELS